jgi:hypothetical protein
VRHDQARQVVALAALVSVGVVISACGLDTAGDYPADARPRDVTTPDARVSDGQSADSRTADVRTMDAHAPDVRVHDGAAADSHVADVRETDAGIDDAAIHDTGIHDTGIHDVGTHDAVHDAEADAASRDAGRDARATFCATVTPPPTFCADFDEPDASAGGGWNVLTATGDASVTLSPTTFMSAPRSLETSSPHGGTGSVSLNFSLVSSMSVDFDVQYVAVPSSGDISAILLTGPTYPGQDIYFFVSSNSSYFQEFGDDFSSMMAAPSQGAWHHVSISVTTASGVSTINAGVDGTAYWMNHHLDQPWPMATTVTLKLGLPDTYEVTTPTQLYIDNVVVRVD